MDEFSPNRRLKHEKVQNVVRHVNFYKELEMVLPQKDFWKNLL